MAYSLAWKQGNDGDGDILYLFSLVSFRYCTESVQGINELYVGCNFINFLVLNDEILCMLSMYRSKNVLVLKP